MTDSVPASHTQIAEAIAKLRQLTQVNVQTQWHYCLADLAVSEATQGDRWQSWAIADLNAREHIAWTKGREILWLGQQFVIPSNLQGYPITGLELRLALTWWAELAQIFINGKLVQEGDLFDHSARILLSPSAQTGEVINVAIRLVSPNHDDGALVRSLLLYETPLSSDAVEPGFVANELAVLQTYVSAFQPEKVADVVTAIEQIDWTVVDDRPQFDRSLSTLRQTLQPLGNWLKQRQIQLVGHAHLDMAWLWDVDETWRAAERTFKSVLSLQQDFPALTFCHSTPALYEWMEQNRPDLFAQIQQQVAAGKWEVVGGMWIEPELNLISGESLVRQVLYGQRYCQEKFGEINQVAWLPDSFGFCWQLPQILKQGGVEYFVTQKLRWNDTTQFPYEVFWWQSPDGTQIFSLMLPPIGEAIDPTKMATYAQGFEAKTGIPTTLWLPGVGDHGGGPTRDMLETAQRWEKSPLFPKLDFTTSLKYLQQLAEEQGKAISDHQPSTKTSSPSTHPPIHPSTPLPIWNDELYLEFHRGCYTTHADQKRFNRRSEELLYKAELFASIATLRCGSAYPKQELETAWKKVLFNQFHDILPGSSIPKVFEDANQAWQEAQQMGSGVLQKSLETIAAHITLPEPPHPDAIPIVVFNPLNWERSQVVKVRLVVEGENYTHSKWKVCDLQGNQISSQCDDVKVGRYAPEIKRHIPTLITISFWAESIPSIGYRCFWAYPSQAPSLTSQSESSSLNLDSPKPESFVLENEFLRVTVDPDTGDLVSIFDKTNQREVLSAPSNQLQAFEDKGQYWDAWNIDPNYAQHPYHYPPAPKIKWVEQGALRSHLSVIRSINVSDFNQDYILETGSPLLKIETRANWLERHVIVKTAFSLNLEANYTTYEIPCGAIKRTTRPQTPAEKAKWEVPALHWADLSNGNYGVSLLNDCKYGYDSTPNQLRLTLLRSARWPNPTADVGEHTFTYALYPHTGTWQTAQTVRAGYELNLPLVAGQLFKKNESIAHPLPPVSQFLDLGTENLVLMALKQSEDSPDEWILRCYECHGEEAQFNLSNDLNLQLQASVNLLEQNHSEKIEGQTAIVPPWKIASFKLSTN
jgi:alpha-mannosidase